MIVLFSFLSCKGQYNIVPMRAWEDTQTIANPALPKYYKDTHSELELFEGTWKYENGNTSFTIVTEKIEQVPNSRDNNITDILTGEYKYVEEGQTIINTLPRLNDTSISPYEHYISGTRFKPRSLYPSCDICQPGDPNLLLFFSDPNPATEWLTSRMGMHRADENGIEKIKVVIYRTGDMAPSVNAPQELSVPYGEYTLIKE